MCKVRFSLSPFVISQGWENRGLEKRRPHRVEILAFPPTSYVTLKLLHTLCLYFFLCNMGLIRLW